MLCYMSTLRIPIGEYYCWQERNACFRFSIVRQDEIHVNTPNAAKVLYLEAIWAKPRHSLA